MRQFNITVNGVTYAVEVEEVGKESASVKTPSVRTEGNAPKAAAPAQKPKTLAAGETVKAPMPGTILDIKVKEGDKIKNGQVLMVLEAMKMENEIVAPRDATVSQVLVSKGDTVNTDDVLIVLQ